MIHTDLTGAAGFWGPNGPDYSAASAAHRALGEKTCRGADFTGWLTLPQTIRSTELPAILEAGRRIRESGDALVVVGIGGSYLGARAGYELMGRGEGGVELLFAGNGLSADALAETMDKLEGRDFCVNVVSKSGTTLEPALGFRVFRSLLEQNYGKEEASRRIFATTDRARGALKHSADENGWPCFVVPDDVGGRYSVLSAVGLLPFAAAGIDVPALLGYAEETLQALDARDESNPAWQYAAARQRLRTMNYSTEILACYEPRFQSMTEWWKQLYGESEGKEGKGIFPAGVAFTADLHSMGQFIQEGPRTLFETVVSFAELRRDFTVPFDPADTDGLNYTAGHSFNEICAIAAAAVKEAHIAGGVPNLGVRVSDTREKGFAELVTFFELACALSGAMQGVNPFDQPGVEAYKKNMFRMLGEWK